MMKYLYAIALAALLSGAAWADEASIDALYFEQKGTMSTPYQLPCNWDKNISGVTIFGYYGADGGFQDIITPLELEHKDKASTDIWFKLPDTAKTHVNGMPLRRVGIDYKATNRRCQSGFGFGGGMVR